MSTNKKVFFLTKGRRKRKKTFSVDSPILSAALLVKVITFNLLENIHDGVLVNKTKIAMELFSLCVGMAQTFLNFSINS